MSKVVAKNAVILVVVELISKVMDMVGVVLLARILGVEVYGFLAFLYSIGLIAALFPHFGFDQMVVRDVSRDKTLTGKYLVDISILKIILSVITISGVAVWLGMFSTIKLEEAPFVYLTTTGFIMLSNTLFMAAFFRAHQRADIEAKVRIVLAFLMMVVTVGAAVISKNLFVILSFRLAVCSIIFVWSFYLIVQRFKPALSFSARRLWSYIQKGWPFAVMMFFIMLYVSIDVAMVYSMRSAWESGLYSGAVRIMAIFYLIPFGVCNAVLPAISQSYQSDYASFFKTVQRAFQYLLILSVFFVLFLLLFSDSIVSLLYGKEFILAGKVLAILCITLMPAFENRLLNNILLAAQKERFLVFLVASSAGFNIVANLILIARFGFAGAALASLMTEVLVFIGQYWFIRRYIMKTDGFVSKSLKFLLCVLIVILGALSAVGQLPVIFVFVAACLVLGWLMIKLKQFNFQEIKLFVEYLFKRRLVGG